MLNRFFNKFITVLLLLVLISNFTFANNLISGYIICKSIDGHIAVEKLNECKYSDNKSNSAGSNETSLSAMNCFDFHLDKNVFGADRYLVKSRITVFLQIVEISSIPDKIFDVAEICNNLNNSELPNQNLINLSTISLLI